MRRLIATVLALSALAVRADFMPKAAFAGETIAQTTTSCQRIDAIDARRTAGELVMRTEMTGWFTFPGPPCSLYYALHPDVPAGTYQVVRESHGFGVTGTGRSIEGTLTVLPQPPVTPAHSALSGNWFDPAAPGRGLNIVQGASGRLLVVWLDHGLTYPVFTGLPLEPNWFVIPSGQWIAPDKFRGLVFQARGTPAALPWKAEEARSEPIGLGTLTFASATEVNFKVEFMTTTGFAAGDTHAATLKRFAF